MFLFFLEWAYHEQSLNLITCVSSNTFNFYKVNTTYSITIVKPKVSLKNFKNKEVICTIQDLLLILSISLEKN